MDRDLLPSSIDTVVIGAGQAGLATSWYLGQAGREHVVLERRDRLGGGWQDRWDDFCLVTPNFMSALPGFAYDGSEPDGFMVRDAIASRIARYAEAIDAPVLTGVEVRRVTPAEAGGGPARFTVTTSAGSIACRHLVVATGGFHLPRIPEVAASLPARVLQLHAHDYRNPDRLPPGAVLVVGSGQSGVQLAEELQAAGRTVFLSVGHCGRVPRRYRGQDFFWWLDGIVTHGDQLGVALPTVEQLPDPRLRMAGNPHLSGHDGGHETDLRRMAAEGLRLAGHLEGADGETVRFAPDLAPNLAYADGFFDERFRDLITTYIARAALDAPPDDREPFDFEPPEFAGLDLAAEGIATVLWTSGYRVDFGWIDFPIFDSMGLPRHRRGVTAIPGLTFIGLPWQRDQVSSTLIGIGRDAADLAARW